MIVARLLRVVPVIAASFLLAAPAQAAVLFLQGTVSNVSDAGLSPTISDGDAFAAAIQVNAGASDSDGSPTQGTYAGAATSASFTAGGFAGTGSGGRITIENGAVSDAMSVFFFPASGFGTVSGSIGAFELAGFFLEAQDFDGSTFASDSLADALALLSLGAFDSVLMTLNFVSGETVATVTIGLSAIRVEQDLPEPSTLALALGLVLLLAWRRPVRLD